MLDLKRVLEKIYELTLLSAVARTKAASRCELVTLLALCARSHASPCTS